MSVRDDIETLVSDLIAVQDAVRHAEEAASRALDAFENEDYAVARGALEDVAPSLQGPDSLEDLIQRTSQVRSEIEEHAGV